MSKKKEFTTAERIVLRVALESMRQLGWHDQPLMLLDTLRPYLAEGMTRQYHVLFTLFGERANIFRFEVTIRASSRDGKLMWVDGVVLAFHSITPVPYPAKFAVIWEWGTPRVVLEPFLS